KNWVKTSCRVLDMGSNLFLGIIKGNYFFIPKSQVNLVWIWVNGRAKVKPNDKVKAGQTARSS
ncbi:MAG: hypothetical protein Q4F05_13570, partial [bacterium]|nr:hypothetical protein [bacterium]